MLGTWETISIGLNVADKLMDAFTTDADKQKRRAEKRYQRWRSNKSLFGKFKPKISTWQYQRMHTMLLRQPAYIWHDEPTPEPYMPPHEVLLAYQGWLSSKMIDAAQYSALLDQLVTGHILSEPPPPEPILS